MLTTNTKNYKTSRQESKQVLKKITKVKKKAIQLIQKPHIKQNQIQPKNEHSKLTLKNKKSSIICIPPQSQSNHKITSILSPQSARNSDINRKKTASQLKRWKSNGNIECNDYNEFQCQKLKTESKWLQKNYRGSLMSDQVFNQYGYSNLSNLKMNGQKSLSSLSKNYKPFPDKQQIQRLLIKYSQHLNTPPQRNPSNSKSKISSSKSKISKSKNKNFRTLSTDDKSQKRLQINRKIHNVHNLQTKNRKDNNSANSNGTTIYKAKNFKTQKNLHSNQQKQKYDKKVKSFKKKKSSKAFLPDYFGCLSINKVQSKIEMMKNKQQKNQPLVKESKDFCPDDEVRQQEQEANMQECFNKTDKIVNRTKSQENLIMTKVKQQKPRQNKQMNKQMYNKQTKKTSFTARLNSQRSTISLLKKKTQTKLKVKSSKRSRKTSKKQIKIN